MGFQAGETSDLIDFNQQQHDKIKLSKYKS